MSALLDLDQNRTSKTRRPPVLTNVNIGGTDVVDGNAGEPDLYRTGRRDGRSVAEAAGLIVDNAG